MYTTSIRMVRVNLTISFRHKACFVDFDPLTIFHRDRTVSEASLSSREELVFTRMIQTMRLIDAKNSLTKKR